VKLFSWVHSDRTRGNKHQLEHRQLKLDIRKPFCTVRKVKHWHRFPRETVESPSLQTQVDMALSSLL